MAHALTAHQARLLRARAQWLTADPARALASPADVVRHVVGIQAQETSAAALSMRTRRPGLLAADVERALAVERAIVRTWCMRGTLHLVPADDVRWLLALLGPVFIRATRPRRLQLSLDETTAAAAIVALREVLGDAGPLTRAEIVAALARRGFPLEGQARPHLLSLAALQGIICYGPTRGHEPTYVLLADWLPPGKPVAPEGAAAELARRYLAAFAPAAPEDFAAWAGLPLGVARAAWSALGPELVAVSIEGAPAWMLETQASWLAAPAETAPSVRLLPGWDTYLMGYRRRETLTLDPAHAADVLPGGGTLRPTLLVDGRLLGTWRLVRGRGGPAVDVAPFAPLSEAVLPGLEVEAADVGRFVGERGTLSVWAD